MVVDRRMISARWGPQRRKTPPSATTLLTLAQYQAQSSNPSMAAGTDGIRFLNRRPGTDGRRICAPGSVGMQAI